MKLKVNTGPLKGRHFDNLLDFLDAQEMVRRKCAHRTKGIEARVMRGETSAWA
jgi:hypothetical protein